jgi:hypothetical protein
MKTRWNWRVGCILAALAVAWSARASDYTWNQAEAGPYSWNDSALDFRLKSGSPAAGKGWRPKPDSVTVPAK